VKKLLIILLCIVSGLAVVTIVYPLLLVILYLGIIPKITQEFILWNVPKDSGVTSRTKEIITTGAFQEDLVINQQTNLSAEELEIFYQSQVEKYGWKKIKGDCNHTPEILNCIFAYTRTISGTNYMLSFPINKYKSEPTTIRFLVRTF